MILHLWLNFVSILEVIIINSKNFLRDFCFDVKITSCKSTCTVKKPQAPPFKFNNLFNEHFSELFFFSEVFFRLKASEVEVNCY